MEKKTTALLSAVHADAYIPSFHARRLGVPIRVSSLDSKSATYTLPWYNRFWNARRFPSHVALKPEMQDPAQLVSCLGLSSGSPLRASIRISHKLHVDRFGAGSANE